MEREAGRLTGSGPSIHQWLSHQINGLRVVRATKLLSSEVWVQGKEEKDEEADEKKREGLRDQDECIGTSALFGFGLQSRVMGRINFREQQSSLLEFQSRCPVMFHLWAEKDVWEVNHHSISGKHHVCHFICYTFDLGYFISKHNLHLIALEAVQPVEGGGGALSNIQGILMIFEGITSERGVWCYFFVSWSI